MSKKSNKKKKEAAQPEISWTWVKPLADRYAIVVGIGLGVFFRPFIDGIVWPASNSYFAWAFALLLAVWAGKAVLTKTTLRGGIPLAIHGLFVAMALVTVWTTIRLDLTYNALPALLTGAIALVLGINAATSEAQRRVVIAFVIAACVGEAFYGIYHVTYVLPQARAAVNTNPALIEMFFPGAVITDDLRHRLESNRAFGTFLFPNAYAAFLILGLPMAVAGAWRSFIKTDDATNTESPSLLPASTKEWPATAKWLGIALFGTVFVVVLIGTEFFIEVALRADFENTSPLRNGGFRYACSIGLAAITSIVPPWLCKQYGIDGARTILGRVLLPIVSIIVAYGALISGTRGALLGIAAAIALTAAAYVLQRVGIKRATTTVAVAVLIIGACAALVPLDATAQGGTNLNIQGRVDDSGLGRYFTMIYRVHYWRIAWSAFLDNMAGGVGFGAYESAFTKYQYMGAPHAMMVHNDYLQALAETGLLGGAAFIAFWVYFAIAGFMTLLREKSLPAFLAIAGPYTGCMAFAAHQVVDFGFQNPSLTLPVYLVAGLCLSQTNLRTIPTAIAKPLLILFLIAAAITAGWTSRVYIADQAFTALGPRALRFNAANFLLIQTSRPDIAQLPFSANAITSFVGNSKKLDAMGFFGEPTDKPRHYRRIPTSRTVPSNAAFFISDPAAAKAIGIEATHAWIDRYKEVDAKYPYSPDLALDIRLLYVTLWNATDDLNEKVALAEESMKWAYIQLERAPYDGSALQNVAWAHWINGQSLPKGEQQLGILLDSLEQFRAVTDLIPSQPFVYHEYSLRLTDVIRAYGDSNPELAEELLAKREWADSQEKLALKRSPFSLTGETHADILRKWPELEPTGN